MPATGLPLRVHQIPLLPEYLMSMPPPQQITTGARQLAPPLAQQARQLRMDWKTSGLLLPWSRELQSHRLLMAFIILRRKPALMTLPEPIPYMVLIQQLQIPAGREQAL